MAFRCLLFLTNLVKICIAIFPINLRGFILSPTGVRSVLPWAVRLIPYLPPHQELREMQEDAHIDMQILPGP